MTSLVIPLTIEKLSFKLGGASGFDTWEGAMETIRLIVEKVILGEEVAFRVWSPDCSGLGIIAKTDEEAVTLAEAAVAELRKARGQHLPFRMTTLRSANDHSDREASGSLHPQQ